MVAPVPAPPSNHCKEQEEHSGPSKRIDSTVPSPSSTQSPSRPLATFGKPLKNLTFADLLEATNGFHNDRLISSGGFDDVYKAWLKDGNVVAIKKLIHVSGQGDREFMAEMETIGKAKLPANSGSSTDRFSLGSVLTPPREAQARGRTPPSSPKQLPIPFSQLPPFLSPLPLCFSSGTFTSERQPSLDSALGRPWLRLSLPIPVGGDSWSPRLRPSSVKLSASAAPSAANSSKLPGHLSFPFPLFAGSPMQAASSHASGEPPASSSCSLSLQLFSLPPPFLSLHSNSPRAREDLPGGCGHAWWEGV